MSRWSGLIGHNDKVIVCGGILLWKVNVVAFISFFIATIGR